MPLLLPPLSEEDTASAEDDDRAPLLDAPADEPMDHEEDAPWEVLEPGTAEAPNDDAELATEAWEEEPTEEVACAEFADDASEDAPHAEELETPDPPDELDADDEDPAPPVHALLTQQRHNHPAAWILTIHITPFLPMVGYGPPRILP